ncbi:hypothetical protein N7509_010684 [Penicillium cosmopolitanum]|uniref:DRBM domain-containing protein n=1 Tax=Penicillium cosmopolitanum TaxID=1131564 RepID=A0A9X0B4T1_9EURO|nr:uncharacterized protein N7509_010684 [Penicillium cosmopolitanum]KAJ5388143.1 hypothetical protein N7509_010684 [Penicillium cosmopolitanum]
MLCCSSTRIDFLACVSTGLCRRRRWPEPSYEAYTSPTGFTCVVRVNNREYQTDAVYGSEELARESAAMRAYLICRNFSVNDGKYPAGTNHGGIVQGIPVAIGTGRKSSRDDDTDTSVSSSGGSWSGGSSPERMVMLERGERVIVSGVPGSARELAYSRQEA